MAVRSMQVAMAEGQMTSDVVRKNTVVERAIWRRADFLSAGVKMLPIKTYNTLDIAASFPSNLIGNYPLAPGAKVQLERVSWTPYGYTLYKFEARWAITGEAKIRQQDQQDQRAAMRKVATALAFWKDKDIIDKVIAGEYTASEVAVSPGDEWNSGNPSADPEGNIVDAWNNLISGGYSSTEEISKIALLIPANVLGQVNKLMLIGNVQQRLRDYIKGNYSIDIFPTLYTDAITHPPGSIYTLAGSPAGISDDAFMVVFGEDTGEHGVLRTNVIPMAGHTVKDTGDEEWFMRQFFGSKIQPNSSGDATNVGIVKISNVC